MKKIFPFWEKYFQKAIDKRPRWVYNETVIRIKIVERMF